MAKPTLRVPLHLAVECNKNEEMIQVGSGVLAFIENGESRKGRAASLVRKQRLARWIVGAYDKAIDAETGAGTSSECGSSDASPPSPFLCHAADWVVSFAWRHLDAAGDPAAAAANLALCFSKLSLAPYQVDWTFSTLFLCRGLANPMQDLAAAAATIPPLFGPPVFSLRFAQKVAEILAIHAPETLSIVRTGSACGLAGVQSIGVCGGGCAGVSVAALVRRWTDQCFWNFLRFELVLVFVALGAPASGTTGASRHAARGSDLQAGFVACALAMAVAEYCGPNSKSSGMPEERHQRERSLREVLLDGPLFPPRRTPGISSWLESIKKMNE